jgi:hypothetical protein
MKNQNCQDVVNAPFSVEIHVQEFHLKGDELQKEIKRLRLPRSLTKGLLSIVPSPYGVRILGDLYVCCIPTRKFMGSLKLKEDLNGMGTILLSTIPLSMLKPGEAYFHDIQGNIGFLGIKLTRKRMQELYLTGSCE